jgi:hypothetical protein
MPAKQTWIILTSGEEPMQRISDQLKEKGFTIDSTLDAIGQIIASGTEDMKNKAKQIKGVSDIVSSGDNIQIGPPENEITW